MKNSLLLIVLFAFNSASYALIGGTAVKNRVEGPARSIVLIEIIVGELKDNRRSYCTATLTGPHSIVLAAHCFDPRVIKHTNLSHNLVFDINHMGEAEPLRLPVVRKSIHPSYGSIKTTNVHDGSPGIAIDHDIAVAQFQGEIPSGYAPAAIDSDSGAFYGDKSVQVFGFGRAVDYTGAEKEDLLFTVGVLRTAFVELAGNYNEQPDYYKFTPEATSFLCQGDSGGPQFLVDSSGRYKLVGVNSGAGLAPKQLQNKMFPCRYPGSRATKIAPFYNWVQRQITQFN